MSARSVPNCWHHPLCQQPDSFFIGGIQRLDDEVLDTRIDEFLVIADGSFWRTREGEAAPAIGKALFQTLGKVVLQFRLQVYLVLSEDEPAREVRSQHRVERASESVAMLAEYRELVPYSLSRGCTTDHA